MSRNIKLSNMETGTITIMYKLLGRSLVFIRGYRLGIMINFDLFLNFILILILIVD